MNFWHGLVNMPPPNVPPPIPPQKKSGLIIFLGLFSAWFALNEALSNQLMVLLLVLGPVVWIPGIP